ALRELNDSDNIRVNAVASGFETPITKQTIEKFGFVPIDEAIDAYITIIEDDKLVGDVIAIPKTNQSYVVPKSYLD
ncbi:34825_t:CDS:2, partial [Racocetra persica]